MDNTDAVVTPVAEPMVTVSMPASAVAQAVQNQAAASNAEAPRVKRKYTKRAARFFKKTATKPGKAKKLGRPVTAAGMQGRVDKMIIATLKALQPKLVKQLRKQIVKELKG